MGEIAIPPTQVFVFPLQLSELALSLVTGVVEFCTGALSVDDPVTPDPMREVLQILHGKSRTRTCCLSGGRGQ